MIRRIRGELVGRAAAIEMPEDTEPTLKDPSEFRLIGREGLPRVDIQAKAREGLTRFVGLRPLPVRKPTCLKIPPRRASSADSPRPVRIGIDRMLTIR